MTSGHIAIDSWSSVTRLGDFYKLLVANLPANIAQIFNDFWGILKNNTFM